MESMPSTRRARQEALVWQAVDRRDFVLDVLVQSRRNAKGAKRLMRKYEYTRLPYTSCHDHRQWRSYERPGSNGLSLTAARPTGRRSLPATVKAADAPA
jgi:hypothetical protein